VEGCEAPHAK